MKPGRLNAPGDQTTGAASEAEATGLPGIRTWRTVYLIVLGIFVLWIGLLTWLTEVYK